MPIEIIDVDDGLGTLITGTGVIAAGEFIKTFQKQLTLPSDKRRKYLYSLSDFTGVTKVELPAATIESFANMCNSASSVTVGTVIAVVANKDMLSGPLKIWEVLCNEAEWEIRMFQGKEEARNWISQRLKDKWNITDLTFANA